MPEVASSKDRPAVRRAVLASVLAVLFFTVRAGSDGVPTPPDMKEVLGGCPVLQGALSGAILKQVIVNDPLGAAVCRLYASGMGGNCYVAWSRSKPVQLSSVMTGLFWVLDCRDTETPAGDEAPVDAGDIWISADPTAIMPCAPASPVIASIAVDGSPMKPFHSEGDLWMSTWADDGRLYSGWGDGAGVKAGTIWTDCGVAHLSGSLPNLAAEEMCFTAPTAAPNVNDKPSSLLCINGRLIGAFHSPLGNAWIGYLAYSDDHGASWTRVGFHEEGDLWPVGGSPWVRDTNSPFRCLFFINMGQDYSLNTDGFVYALGIGTASRRSAFSSTRPTSTSPGQVTTVAHAGRTRSGKPLRSPVFARASKAPPCSTPASAATFSSLQGPSTMRPSPGGRGRTRARGAAPQPQSSGRAATSLGSSAKMRAQTRSGSRSPDRTKHPRSSTA
jgi:hypothetical protein